MKMLLSVEVQCADFSSSLGRGPAPTGAVPSLPHPHPRAPCLELPQARGSGLGEENRLVKLPSEHFSYPNTNAFATPVPQGHVSH